MNLYFRMLVTLLASRWGKGIEYDEPLRTSHWVLPLDLDVFGHMNNGRYLQMMDLSRVNWMSRSGVLRAMFSRRWGALIGGACVRFRRSLKLFQRYQIETRLLSWDQRWWFIQHRFMDHHQQAVALGVVRCALRDGNCWVDTDEVLSAVSPYAVPAVPPEYVARWMAAENAMWRGVHQPTSEVDGRPGSSHQVS